MRTSGYGFREKDNWRRWQWNRIVERLRQLGKRPSDAVVLYFPGEEDLDREVALSHKFAPDNLIGVDVSRDVVRKMRSEGKLCVHGGLNDVLANIGIIPDVVVPDFCSGMTRETIRTAYQLLHVFLHPGCVVAGNFLRGRDPLEKLSDLPSGVISELKALKHRGHQWLACGALLEAMYIKNLANRAYGEAELRSVSFGRIIDNFLDDQPENLVGVKSDAKPPHGSEGGVKLQGEKMVVSRLQHITTSARPVMFSYRSVVGQYFDSIVFSTAGLELYGRDKSAMEKITKWRSNYRERYNLERPSGKRVGRQIAAVLAHRTRRIAQ